MISYASMESVLKSCGSKAAAQAPIQGFQWCSGSTVCPSSKATSVVLFGPVVRNIGPVRCSIAPILNWDKLRTNYTK